MDASAVAIPSVIAVAGLSVIAYFMRRSFEELAKDVRAALEMLATHNTRITVMEVALKELQAVLEGQRERLHELHNVLQGHALKLAKGRR
jgi:muramoyltetrapeptide carboxypeptidase LdcA involved in peptidoglycan recycling